MKTPAWLSQTSHKDWFINGRHCTATDWENLDWTEAFVDAGLSPAGNRGPYWHVWDKEHDCQHRLYPKLPDKWRAVIYQAMIGMPRS